MLTLGGQSFLYLVYPKDTRRHGLSQLQCFFDLVLRFTLVLVHDVSHIQLQQGQIAKHMSCGLCRQGFSRTWNTRKEDAFRLWNAHAPPCLLGICNHLLAQLQPLCQPPHSIHLLHGLSGALKFQYLRVLEELCLLVDDDSHQFLEVLLLTWEDEHAVQFRFDATQGLADLLACQPFHVENHLPKESVSSRNLGDILVVEFDDLFDDEFPYFGF